MKQFFDRRKHNFNLLIMAILLFLFLIEIYNQKLIINIENSILEIKDLIENHSDGHKK